MTTSCKKYIYLLLMLLLPVQLKAMEIIGAGAAAAALFMPVVLKRLKTHASMGSSSKELSESDKKRSLKADLDKLVGCSDDVWSIIRAYIGDKYQVDIVKEMSKSKYPWSSTSPAPAISALEFSSNDQSDIINIQRLYSWNLKDPDFLKQAKGIIWAKVLESEHKEDKKNCYLAWAITSKGLEHLHNQCQPYDVSISCFCGSCFASSPVPCGGAKFNHYAMAWKPRSRPEVFNEDGIPCFATVDDHTDERGGRQLSVLMAGNGNDKEIYDLLDLKVPTESSKGR